MFHEDPQVMQIEVPWYISQTKHDVPETAWSIALVQLSPAEQHAILGGWKLQYLKGIFF